MRCVNGILCFFVVYLLFACEDNSVPVQTHQPTVNQDTKDLNHTQEPPAPDPEVELLKKTNRVKRINDHTLTVALNSGEIITLEDKLTDDPSFISYRAIDLITGRFLIVAIGLWECNGNIRIIDLVSGSTIDSAGNVIPSPTNNMLLTYYNDGIEQFCMGNSISILHYDNKKITQDFIYEQFGRWGPKSARWLDAETIEFDIEIYGVSAQAGQQNPQYDRFLKHYKRGWYFQPQIAKLDEKALLALLESRKPPPVYEARRAVDIDGQAPLDILHFSLKKQQQGYLGKLELRTVAKSLWLDEFTVSETDMNSIMAEDKIDSVSQWVEKFFEGKLKFGAHYTNGRVLPKDIDYKALADYAQKNRLSVKDLKRELLNKENYFLVSYYRDQNKPAVKLAYLPRHKSFIKLAN